MTRPKECLSADDGRVLVRVPAEVVPHYRRAAARQILRMLTLRLMKSIDDPDADLRTLAEQAKQSGEMTLAELDEK